MTRARPVFAGDILHIQRRTIHGRFFLVPNEKMLALARYAFGVAAKREGLRIHLLCVMSNHIHVVATDPHGKHPDFTAYAHRLMALALQQMYGIEEAVWAPGGPSVQRLLGPDGIADALAYVRVNPIEAGCVRDEHTYHGLFGADERAPFKTHSERIERPAAFGLHSTLPASVEFKTEPVQELIDQLGEKRASELIVSYLQRRREQALAERAAKKLGYLGMKRVLSADVWQRAPKPRSGGIRPTFKGVTAKAIRQGSYTLRAFRLAYADALTWFRLGEREVEFPLGTYKMKRSYGVRVAPARGAPAILSSAA